MFLDPLAPRPVYGNVVVTAVRAGSCVALVLLVLHAIGRTDLAPYAAMGCFTALYARDDTYARRARLLAVVAAVLTLAVALGGLASAVVGHPLAAIAVVAVVACGAKYLSDALSFGAPAGLMFGFAAGVAAYAPQNLADVPEEVAVAALAGALCWVAAMVGVLVHPTAPERLVVARALRAVARHLREPDPSTLAAAETAVHHAWRVLGGVRRRREAHQGLEVLLARAEGLLAGTGGRVGDGRAAAELGEVARRLRRERTVDPLVGEREHAVLAAHVERVRGRRGSSPGVGGRLRGALRRPSPTPVTMVRIALACVAAGVLAWVLGIGHGYWAAVSAAAVLQAVNVTTTWHRTLQRALGTVVGVLVAVVLFSFDYSPLGIIALVVVCQMGAELVVGTNYSYAMVFVTPLTVALSSLNNPDVGGYALAAERLGATVLGAVVGVVVCVVVSNRRAGRHLRQALAACERVCDQVEAEGGHSAVRHRLAHRLVEVDRAHALALGEPWVARPGVEEVERVRRRARALLDRSRPGVEERVTVA